MIYQSTKDIKKENHRKLLFLILSVAMVIISRITPYYQWLFEAFAIIFVTCLIYLFVRYDVRYSYEMKKRLSSGEDETEQWEFIVWKQKSRKTPVAEARFQLKDMTYYGVNPSSNFEKVQLEKNFGNPVIYRYVSHVGKQSETILIFENDSYGKIGVVIDGTDFISFLDSI